MRTSSNIKSRLEEKRLLHGIWRLIQSEPLTEIISSSGFDFQIFDREHGSYDFASLETAIRTCELCGSAPLVRVTGINATEVQKCLDLGAHGIVFPQLKNLDDFRRAVQCMKFPPLGCRGFNPFTRAGNYAAESDVVPEKLTDAFAVCVPIVETLSAVDKLDSILALPGIDLLYVGAYDLSVQLGCKGVMNHPTLMNTIADIIAKSRTHNVPSCVMVNGSEQMGYFRELGVSVFVHTVDTNVVRGAFHEKAKQFLQLSISSGNSDLKGL